MASSTIHIRCNSEDIADKVLEFLEQSDEFADMIHREELEVDSNYDVTKTAYRTIKISEKDE